MEIQTGLIWGDDEETTTFAKSFTEDLCLIFRFSIDANLPQSLSSRIPACYHNLSVQDESQTFADKGSMRKAIRSLIQQAWPQCITDPSIRLQDVVIDIYEDSKQQVQYFVCHESTFTQYIDSLLLLSGLFTDETRIFNVERKPHNFVHYSTLIPIQILGGRGSSSLVRSFERPGKLYVFKGVDFGLFLESSIDFPHERDTFYHELRITASMPRHPNIIPPPDILVLATRVQDCQQLFICGTLYPFMKNGSLDQAVDKCETTKMRLPLRDKAKWCHQMALAVAHTHFTANTYHMDIKLGNFLLNDNKDLILIDWEQSGAPLSTLAPEANGCWDVEIVETPFTDNKLSCSTPLLVYKKYNGPPRQNLWSWPKWNVFPIWREQCPKALEKAEVFSLGRTMWMLLQQISEVEENTITIWDESASDIPQSWKTLVSRCVEVDPNKRIGLSELTSFWKQARGER